MRDRKRKYWTLLVGLLRARNNKLPKKSPTWLVDGTPRLSRRLLDRVEFPSAFSQKNVQTQTEQQPIYPTVAHAKTNYKNNYELRQLEKKTRISKKNLYFWIIRPDIDVSVFCRRTLFTHIPESVIKLWSSFFCDSRPLFSVYSFPLLQPKYDDCNRIEARVHMIARHTSPDTTIAKPGDQYASCQRLNASCIYIFICIYNVRWPAQLRYHCKTPPWTLRMPFNVCERVINFF